MPFNLSKTRIEDSRIRRVGSAFTLVELLVSMTFLVILMLVVTQVIGIVQRTWVRANSRVSQFREARVAFDVISRNLSQATLNTYWENEFDPLRTDSAGQQITKAKDYIRQSELQFICGPTTQLLSAAGGKATSYPGHGVFFQAPLGVTNLVAASGQQANTENMVNLLCGRGYFVEWGSDDSFRPAFLNSLTSVPTRQRLRLMEYSPTAEKNQIYNTSLRPITQNSKKWFQDALTSVVQSSETVATRAFTRPVAENVLCLVISPQVETLGNTTTPPYSIAPQYLYDSTQKVNAGGLLGTQGTQHLLPPLLKIAMVALDQRAGEMLSSDSTLQQAVLKQASTLFTSAQQMSADLDGTAASPGTLEAFLQQKKLNYRIFTTTIALKQGRWSF